MLKKRNIRIIATLGPASNNETTIHDLVEAGVDVFRINASHSNHDDIRASFMRIRKVEQEMQRNIGILIDLQGPKLRIGHMNDGVILQKGQRLQLDLDPTSGTNERAPLPHPEILSCLKPNNHLLINDGKIKLLVESCDHQHAITKVLIGGPLSSNKGVNLPDLLLPIDAMTPKDSHDLELALELGIDWIALSFVQRPEDVIELKNIVKGRAGVLAKIEKPSALHNIDAIIQQSDAIMVARGDLGVELPAEQVPGIQKMLIQKGLSMGKPVVVATQMLESMIENPIPTRAEVSDVATAVFEGTDAIMLSAESAMGKYPVEAVSMMDRVACTVENSPEYWQGIQQERCPPEATASDAITAAARQVAETIEAGAIVSYTTSGSTALRVSRERPSVPILVLVPQTASARRLSFTWGLNVMVMQEEVTGFRQIVEKACQVVVEQEIAFEGQKIVLTAGIPFGISGTTNLLRIATAGRKQCN